LKLRTKANLTHVRYKGAGPALNDLLGSHVDMYFPAFPRATPLLKGGQVKSSRCPRPSAPAAHRACRPSPSRSTIRSST